MVALRPAEQRPAPLVVSTSPTAVTLAAPAKLNLFLEVLGRRSDGYHELATLMVALDWCDTLEVRLATEGERHLECEPAGSAPCGSENLVWRAAELLAERVGRHAAGWRMRLSKRVPSQAGLGGGSSDAAAALLGLQRLWKLALTQDELVAIGAAVGSDVPFFLAAPVGWCTGRGEVVAEESLACPLHFVVVCPPVGLATGRVYAALQLPRAPRDGSGVREALRRGEISALGERLFNRLQEPALELEPLLGRLHRRLGQAAPFGACLSGSGSALFALCRSRAEAVHVAEAFLRQQPADEPRSRVVVVQSLAPHRTCKEKSGGHHGSAHQAV
jgi:4-diphosphocytidyl-2-C-methyl-D-erythritol kinase